MNILLATAGSRGDVQPLIALSLALKAAGHDILLCAPPEHEDWVKSYACSYRAVGSNVMAYIEKHGDTRSIKALRGLIRFLQGEIGIQTHGLIEILDEYDADIIIGSSLLLGAGTAAEVHHRPYCYIAFCPQIFPSKHHPMIHIRNHHLPGWINRLSWWGFRKLDMNFNYRRIINEERRRLGLPPISGVYRHILNNHVIVASDELLGRVPPDVVQDFTQIGYCHLQQQGTLPPELRGFLDSGSPPVFIGFGSMPAETPLECTRRIVEAARIARKRVILSRGWAKLGQRDLGDDVIVVEDVPHELLFPEVAAVVHHGGSGTTATAARSGVPQVIVPHIMDQFYWANQIFQRKLGPKPIRRSQLTIKRLADAITECRTTAEFGCHARKCAERLRRPDPLRRGVKVIEALCRSTEGRAER